jgi:ABC-type Fe3+ transport system substrate-binding protein
MKKGEPVAIAPMQEGVPVVPAPVGAFKDAPNPEMAKKALSWMLSKKGQSIVAGEIMTYSARPDVAPPPGLPPLSKVKLLRADFEKVYKEQDKYRAFMERLLRRR